MVTNNFDLSEMINKSIFILLTEKNEIKNEIYIDYTLLKLFIHDDIYDKIIDHILALYNECIIKHGDYSINLNLDGFTISAAERHKNAVKLFSEKSFNVKEFNYVDLVNKIRIINSPSIMDTLIKIFKPFFGKNIKEKIEIYKKNDSINITNQLGIPSYLVPT